MFIYDVISLSWVVYHRPVNGCKPYKMIISQNLFVCRKYITGAMNTIIKGDLMDINICSPRSWGSGAWSEKNGKVILTTEEFSSMSTDARKTRSLREFNLPRGFQHQDPTISSQSRMASGWTVGEQTEKSYRRVRVTRSQDNSHKWGGSSINYSHLWKWYRDTPRGPRTKAFMATKSSFFSGRDKMPSPCLIKPNIMDL